MGTSYLEWLFWFVLLPFMVLWLVNGAELWKYRLVLLRVMGMSLLFGAAWDVYATIMHIWFWPPECCILPRVLGIPLEEALFIAGVSGLAAAITLTLRQAMSPRRGKTP